MKPILALVLLALASRDATAMLSYAEARALPRATSYAEALRPSHLTISVRDEAGRPVPGAWVLLDQGGTRTGSLSDARGFVRLPGVAPGMYRLLIRSDGWAPYTKNVTCPAPLPVDVRLMPASGEAGG